MAQEGPMTLEPQEGDNNGNCCVIVFRPDQQEFAVSRENVSRFLPDVLQAALNQSPSRDVSYDFNARVMRSKPAGCGLLKVTASGISTLYIQ